MAELKQGTNNFASIDDAIDKRHTHSNKTLLDEYTGIPEIDDLTNVEIVSIQNNQILKYDNVSGKWENVDDTGGGVGALDDITDVTITIPADNEVLAYDNVSSEWINQTASEAGLSIVGHTHTAVNITDFDTEVSNNSSVVANTAKVTFDTTASTKVGHISITQAVDLDTIETNSHTHSNKALLDTYTQTEVNLADAVSKKHTHANQTVLDGISQADMDKVDWISVTQAVDLDTMETDIGLNNTHRGSSSNPHTTTILNLDDVTITTIADNEILTYNNSTSKWINETLSEAGISATGHTHTASNITDFDTEVSSNTSVTANTSKITFDSTASTKVGHLSVTQAVNLDTMETDISSNNTHRTTTTGNPHQLELADLEDVDSTVGSPSDGKIMVYRDAGTDWILEDKPAGGSNPAMNDLTDVTISAVADNEVLAYNSGTSEWINQTSAEAGLSATGHTHTASNITDFDTEVSNNTDVAASKVITDWISITQAVDLDTIESNVITNNSKISFNTTASTKVGHLTVTQAVDLDTIELDTVTNNGKVTNADHTGEVTGSAALTIVDNIIDEANLKLETAPTNDYV